jgi:hypothetical protein
MLCALGRVAPQEEIMKRIRKTQIAIAALALFAGVGTYMTMMPRTDAFIGVCTYYQTAQKKKVVGQRGTGCCGEPMNWGEVTAYKTCEQIYCADVWCPPPTE